MEGWWENNDGPLRHQEEGCGALKGIIPLAMGLQGARWYHSDARKLIKTQKRRDTLVTAIVLRSDELSRLP
jgi:hypothetical protein